MWFLALMRIPLEFSIDFDQYGCDLHGDLYATVMLGSDRVFRVLVGSTFDKPSPSDVSRIVEREFAAVLRSVFEDALKRSLPFVDEA